MTPISQSHGAFPILVILRLSDEESRRTSTSTSPLKGLFVARFFSFTSFAAFASITSSKVSSVQTGASA